MSGSQALHNPDCYLLEEDADETLLGLLARDNEPPPHYALAQYRREPTPVEGFDKVAFRRHMRRLIEQRAAHRKYQEALRLEHEEIVRQRTEKLRRAVEAARAREAADKVQRAYEDERRELDRLLAQEVANKAPPKPQPKPAPPKLVYELLTYPYPQHQKQNVEPWFDPARQPTLGDLRCIAQYTLGYFVAARRPAQPGTSHIGQMTTRVVCPRDADAIATAMMQVKTAIPHLAHLSAALLDVPEGVFAVTLGCPFVALQVASLEEGKRVSIEVTWDE